MIILYTTFYRDKDQARQEELELALSRNILNTNIAEIKLFVDDPDQFEEFRSEKVSLIQCIKRIPTYGDFLSAAEQEPVGTVIVIANTDICFDDTLSQVLEWDLKNRLLVVTRREGLPEQQPLLTEHYMSSDAWIFQSPPLTQFCPVTLGRLHCESMFLGFMQNKGYSIHNVSLEIHGFHIHQSNKRNYDPNTDRYTAYGRMVYPVISSAYVHIASKPRQPTFPCMIDGAVFASAKPAAIKVWCQLLQTLGSSSLKEEIVILDRGGLNLHNFGFRVIEGPTFNPNLSLNSSEVLDNICIKHGTRLFVQTTAVGPSVCSTIAPFWDLSFMQSGVDRLQIISEYFTAATCSHALFFHDDLRQLFLRRFPRLTENNTTLLKLGPPSIPTGSSTQPVTDKYGLRLPYLLYVGETIGFANYRNAESLLSAMDESRLFEHFQVFFMGCSHIDEGLKVYESGKRAVAAIVPDSELGAIYTGAFAHISSSRFKGLEFSILESMQCLCPSIIVQYDQTEREYWRYALVSDQLQGLNLVEIIELLRNDKFRMRITAGAKCYVDSLSWSPAAETLKALLEREIRKIA